MKSKIILTTAVAGAMAMGAMTSMAHALDLGVGGGTRAHVGAGTNVGIGTNNDASGGIMARNDARVNAGVSGNASTDDDFNNDDARFHSGVDSRVNADTSAGADEAADLRSQIRNDIDADARANADVNAKADVAADADTSNRSRRGLFGLSLGSNARATTRASLND